MHHAVADPSLSPNADQYAAPSVHRCLKESLSDLFSRFNVNKSNKSDACLVRCTFCEVATSLYPANMAYLNVFVFPLGSSNSCQR